MSKNLQSLLKKLFLVFNTVKYLKIKQIFWRILYYVPRTVKYEFYHPEVQKRKAELAFIQKSGITKDLECFTFLNESYQFSKIGWDNKKISKLWRYNLHYFEYLLDPNALLTDKEVFVHKWIEENQFGLGTGWEPYPTSLRIINWIKWYWQGGNLNQEALISLWNQVKWIGTRPEYHLLGNHLFVNAKALFFAAAFFQLDNNSDIYKKAMKILREELDEQFLEDGGHFELSPMYHSLAMEDLLDLLNISNLLPNNFPTEKIRVKIQKGLIWLNYFTYANQELAHFNDCANGIAPKINELMEYAHRINLMISNPDKENSHFFKETGFFVYKNRQIHLIADLGKVGPDYIPGHAHADTLSFELALNGQRVIVNSGTSEYGVSQERLKQRSTSAHSTVTIGEENSSEVWSGFRVARRAKIVDLETREENNQIRISASHDGYRRLKSKPLHKRVFTVEGNMLQVEDHISGKGNQVKIRYYLHPSVKINFSENEMELFTSKEHLAVLKFSQAEDIKVINTSYHDYFGLSRENKCIIISGVSPFRFSAEFKFRQ